MFMTFSFSFIFLRRKKVFIKKEFIIFRNMKRVMKIIDRERITSNAPCEGGEKSSTSKFGFPE